MNVYYDPEKFGLETVGEIDRSSGSYEFDLFVVWRNKAGKIFWDTDSGCSCPTPFEESSLESLTGVTTAGELRNAIDSWGGVNELVTLEDIQELIDRSFPSNGEAK